MGNSFLLQFDNIEMILLSILLVLFVIEVFFYLFFYNKPLSYQKKRAKNETEAVDTNRPSVSVMIVIEDYVENLRENLTTILTQDYPDYEVIVVNNGYMEEANLILKQLHEIYPHLYNTFLPFEPLEQNTNRRKLASTIGIKAAKKDVLLFIEPDATPSNERWMSSMMDNMTDDKEVVLGYCCIKNSTTFWGKVAKFDNLLYSLKYLSMAILNKPFTGTTRNVAYRKNLFFENKGFSAFLNYAHSEDLFLNHIITAQNTTVSLTKDSFVYTDIHEFYKWKSIKETYYRTKRRFKSVFSSILFSTEIFSRYLFLVVFVATAIYGIINEKWIALGVAAFLYIAKETIQSIIINKSAKYFQAGRYYFSLPCLEVMQPIYNLYFKITSSKRKSEI